MPAEEQRRQRVQFRGPVDAVRRLFRERPLEPQAEASEANVLTFEAFATESEVAAARTLGIAVKEVWTEPSRARRRDVHRSNRFRDGQVPTGAGKLVRP